LAGVLLLNNLCHKISASKGLTTGIEYRWAKISGIILKTNTQYYEHTNLGTKVVTKRNLKERERAKEGNESGSKERIRSRDFVKIKDYSASNDVGNRSIEDLKELRVVKKAHLV
jgi:hypothetical protein